MSVSGNAKPDTAFLPTEQFLLHFKHKGSGPPLLLIHGGGTWLYSFRHNILPLSENFSVYAFDIPGHGFTTDHLVPEQYNIETACRSIFEFIEAANLEKVNLAGHSWGGGWSIYFASRFPERVDKLILLDSSGMHRYEKFPWELMKYRFLQRYVLKFISEKTVANGLKSVFYDKRLVDSDMIKHIYAPLSKSKILEAQLCYSQNIKRKTIQAALPRIRAKTLIIWGRHDRYIHVKHGRKLHRMVPSSRFEIVERCGHCPHEERPEHVNRLITDFLTES